MLLADGAAAVVDGGSAAVETPAPSNANDAGTQNGGSPAASADKGTATEQPLYDLPDGRKVDGATLQNVYKDLLGDYTQKAQTLSQFEKAGIQVKTEPTINTPQNPWEDPNWVPKNYAEIVAASKQAFKAEAEAQTKAEADARAVVTQQIDTELGEIKKLEPNVSEDLLFAHATKYGFTSLKQAFTNMRDLNVAIKATQAQTQKNLANRANEVINTKGGEISTKAEGIDYRQVTQKGTSAIDFLQRIQGK